MRLLILSALIVFSFAPAVMAEDVPPPTPAIAACPEANRAICHTQQALVLVPSMPEYQRSPVLSQLSIIYLAQHQSELAESVIKQLEQQNGGRQEDFNKLLMTLADAGDLETVKRLLPSINLCMPHPHAGCIPPAIATDIALILMKQLIQKNQQAEALNLAFLAIRYNGGIDSRSGVNPAPSPDFYKLIVDLDYRKQLREELDALYAEGSFDKAITGDPESDRDAWDAAKSVYLSRERLKRLLYIIAFDPSHRNEIINYAPKDWPVKNIARLYIDIAIAIANYNNEVSAKHMIEIALNYVKEIPDQEDRINAARHMSWFKFWDRALAKQIIEAIGDGPANGTQITYFSDHGIIGEGKSILSARKFEDLEKYIIEVSQGPTPKSDHLWFGLVELSHEIIKHHLEAGDVQKAHRFFVRAQLLNWRLKSEHYNNLLTAYKNGVDLNTGGSYQERHNSFFKDYQARLDAAFIKALNNPQSATDDIRAQLAVRLANEGNFDKAIEVAPLYLWDNKQPYVFSEKNTVSSYNERFNKWRLELLEALAPNHYDLALRLGQQFTDPYDLARANLYLSQ